VASVEKQRKARRRRALQEGKASKEISFALSWGVRVTTKEEEKKGRKEEGNGGLLSSAFLSRKERDCLMKGDVDPTGDWKEDSKVGNVFGGHTEFQYQYNHSTVVPFPSPTPPL